MASPGVEVSKPDAIPWWPSITTLSAVVSLIIAIAGGSVLLYEKVESAATVLVAGRTTKIHLCERQVGNATLPCQTVLQYKALNPGPAQLQNVGLRVHVAHKKTERAEDWLSVSALGAAELDVRSYPEHTVYYVAPRLAGNLPNQLDPGAIFGISLVATKPDWLPNEVYASWGAANEIPAWDELRLERLFQSRWWPSILGLAAFFGGLVAFFVLIARALLSTRKSREYVLLSGKVTEVLDRLAILSTDPENLRDRYRAAAALLQPSEAPTGKNDRGQ
jgi:hypothetical protein